MYKLSCHCQAVEIELNLPSGLENLCRCNCSMCKRRGTIVAIVDQDNLEVTKGEDKLSLYQFHTNTAKHHFCSVCGIYTHHQTRINTSKYAVNVCMYRRNKFTGVRECEKCRRHEPSIG